MPDFYVNVVLHGGVWVEADNESEAESKARDAEIDGHLSDTYHVDVGTVEHQENCGCDDCREEDKDDNV